MKNFSEAEKQRMLRACAGIERAIGKLPYDEKIVALQSVIAQEICMMPHGEREELLSEAMETLPDAFRGTEQGMREALVDNARHGL